MNTLYNPIENGLVAKARNTFSARLLTDPQFEEFAAICAILHREIHRSGSFIEKLENYAFTISRTEKGINASKADTIIRDLFKALFGETMDQLRKALLKAEEELDDTVSGIAHDFALATLNQVQEGDKIPFHRAYAEQAGLMATELKVTDVAAKKLMSEAFEAETGHPFYEEGKQVEDRFFAPQIQAEKRQRDKRRDRYNGYARSKTGGDPELAESMGVGSSNTQPTPANG